MKDLLLQKIRYYSLKAQRVNNSMIDFKNNGRIALYYGYEDHFETLCRVIRDYVKMYKECK